jgi:hypothetical protein
MLSSFRLVFRFSKKLFVCTNQKMENIFDIIFRGCHHVDWWCLDSRGASSGVLIMWDKKGGGGD